MIFHFDFAHYRRMLALAWNEPNPMARRYFLFILCVSVPLTVISLPPFATRSINSIVTVRSSQ